MGRGYPFILGMAGPQRGEHIRGKDIEIARRPKLPGDPSELGLDLLQIFVGDEDLEKIKAELRWITRELGPARDLDVFAADVLAPLRASHPEDEGIAAAHRDFEERRAAAYASAAGSIRSD